MLIRLIDIVLIVLFGFIAIAKLDNQRKIELPKSKEAPPMIPDTLDVVHLTITQTGELFIDLDQEPSEYSEVEEYLFLRKQDKMKNIEDTLYTLKVTIRAEGMAPFKFVRETAEMCDRLEIPRSIMVEIVR